MISDVDPTKFIIAHTNEDPSSQVGFAPDTVSTSKSSMGLFQDDGEGHLLTIAPTGSGKGTNCIIPNLLHYSGTTVVVDPKGENYAVTAEYRRSMGHKVHALDPFGLLERFPKLKATSDTLNILDLVRTGNDEEWDDALRLANAIVAERIERDPFWDNMAVNLIAGLISYVKLGAPNALRNIGEVHFLLNQSLSDLLLTAKEMIRFNKQGVGIHEAANILLDSEAKVMRSIWGVAKSHMDFAASKTVMSHHKGTSIDLDAFQAGQDMTIYLIFPPERLQSHRALLRLYMTFFLELILRRRNKVAIPSLFMIDEAAQLGPLKQLEQAITLLRGYGVRVWTFWQDLSQLKKNYPDSWETLVNNCMTLQSFGCTNLLMARQLCDLTGLDNPHVVLRETQDKALIVQRGQLPTFGSPFNYLNEPELIERAQENPYHSPVYETTPPSMTEQSKERETQRVESENMSHPGLNTYLLSDVEIRNKLLRAMPV